MKFHLNWKQFCYAERDSNPHLCEISWYSKNLKKKSGFLCLVVDLDYLRNYCTNPKLHFQMKFSLSSTWSLLILLNHVKASRLWLFWWLFLPLRLCPKLGQYQRECYNTDSWKKHYQQFTAPLLAEVQTALGLKYNLSKLNNGPF